VEYYTFFRYLKQKNSKNGLGRESTIVITKADLENDNVELNLEVFSK
jgi:hypothetical protein